MNQDPALKKNVLIRWCSYSFHVGFFHPLLYAGLSRRFRAVPLWEVLGMALSQAQESKFPRAMDLYMNNC